MIPSQRISNYKYFKTLSIIIIVHPSQQTNNYWLYKYVLKMSWKILHKIQRTWKQNEIIVWNSLCRRPTTTGQKHPFSILFESIYLITEIVYVVQFLFKQKRSITKNVFILVILVDFGWWLHGVCCGIRRELF